VDQTHFAEVERGAQVGGWEWKVAGDRMQCSDALCRVYGLDRFEDTLDAFLGFVHPDDRVTTMQAVLDGLRTLEPCVFDYRIVRPDGSLRMLHTRAEVIAGANGRPERLVGCCWDVTDRWQAEESRARVTSLLRATLDSTADGLLVVDSTGRMTAFNQRFRELWRMPPEVREQGSDDFAISLVLDQLEDPDSFVARVRELYAQPQLESYDVLRFRDGRVFERYSRPQRLGDEIVGRVWSFRDVTERERLFRRALFLADASRLLASLDAERACEAVAHLAVPFLGECCALDLFGEKGGPRRLFCISTEKSCPYLDELPRGALTGRSLFYEAHGRSSMAVPLTARDQLIGVLSFAAPDGRKYVQNDLGLAEELGRRMALGLDNARLYRGVREALRARDDFLSVAAHELRGPATSLRLSVESIRSGNVPPSLMQKSLDICDRSVRKIARFIDELLDVSRARAGILQLDFEDVDLGEATREAASHLSHELTRSGSSLSITADPKVVGRWDRSRLEQVVTNLLGNAIKFGQGKPIEVMVRRTKGRAQLVVRDQGLGIPLDRQQAIFEPFERAVSARHYGGLGLGLYICKSIVEALGGTLAVQSEPGHGSTFTVEL
jgi:PAS domain S-box-containing protein